MSVCNTELYELLDVNPNASHDEIKKAYRKKALQNHPDKGGDEELFKKINNAYEILVNQEKRDLYDKFGTTDQNNSPSFSARDIFATMFGDLFGVSKREPPLIHNHSVSLEDICRRRIISVEIDRQRVCDCNGEQIQCDTCEGKGMTMTMTQLFPGMIGQSISPCTNCNGKGKIHSSCKKCKNGITTENKTFDLHLTPEMGDGYKYILKEEGNQKSEHKAGDLIIILSLKKHLHFTVKGNDLFYIKTISLKEALVGNSFEIIHPSGEKIRIVNTEIIDPDTSQVLPKGITEKGELKIRYKIIFPKSLNESQKNQISF